MRRSDRGFVTVEAAMVLPLLAVFTVTLLWGLAAAAAQIRCVDAARAGARAVARSEPVASAEAAARAAAPEGARVSVAREGELWRVTVEAVAPGPRGMGVTLRGGAAALAEDAVGRVDEAGVADTAGAEAGMAGVGLGRGADAEGMAEVEGATEVEGAAGMAAGAGVTSSTGAESGGGP
ncbi:TadE family type IV pilus minor pilin [Streptomyces sp. SP18ES09]|uniref:TadE family type IV pilus minor pilin n=1 Tax=Streptomyces sp. SP18ES09 TaxID=3002532 RepID=UPI002E78FF95|nr:TadE family type IV pilus minor pilin [Streptomyces sp. SP18ES09]MEE1817732.1 TadE family type IV pilus minor pilin [Streptomyces sp. SP18ES09]